MLISASLTCTDMSRTVCPVTSYILTCNIGHLRNALASVAASFDENLFIYLFFCSTSHHILLCLHDECGGQRLAAEHDTGLCKVIYSDLGPSMQAPGRVTVTLSPKSLKTQQRRRGFNSPSIQLNCELKLLLVIINRSFSNDSFRD